ncbi:integral membrane protein [Paenimyroides aquimaris]|uniref:Integral membrane protein n=1 Tax=Paenimyroides marinum TaxID=1159016 RepID=A0A1H6KIZ7_9FLAO|nr:DUF3817 domain-containing protein [Paenimyroides aquimaris]SEH72722.1 integral membrane protein [Paenimyroides aquimaris]
MLNFFRFIGALEGISYLVLFYNMLYNKINNPELYQQLLFPIGMVHGILFVLYVIIAFYLKVEYNWSVKKLGLVLLASLLPFGTFYSDYKWLKS